MALIINKPYKSRSIGAESKNIRKRSKTQSVKKHNEGRDKEENGKARKLSSQQRLKQFSNIFTIEKLVQTLHSPTCSSSLGICRFLYGLMMVIDIPDERGLSEIDIKYGNPMKCHFPLMDWITPLPLENMGILYLIMWIGAAGICLGYKFRLSCLMFMVPYWYLFLLDKTTWNNHSYLYGLLSILFIFTSSHHSFSLDSRLNPSIKNKPVPLWNYAIIKFQFFLLYFYAGIKKIDSDWLGGYSVTNLSLHWVFDPFRIILTDEQIDLWIIHRFGFLFDLTVGFFLLISKTRPIAIVFATAFHVMNSRIFHIGQFPYVCICLTPIFCSYDWPDRLQMCVKKLLKMRHNFQNLEKTGTKENESQTSSTQQKLTVCLILFYVAVQLFLPFSHFITKGYNNWTNGLYGYSWDMMVNNWDSVLTVVKVVDNDSGKEYFIDPEAWVGNLRFSQHGDMLIQYAYCLKRNLANLSAFEEMPKSKFQNISVFVDIWCSLNGRFQQRMFDPRQDLLKAEWSPFENIKWLMPLISDLTPWRQKMSELENEVFARSNDSGILFVADFPDLHLNNYISSELSNVTLTVLQGVVVVEQPNENKSSSVVGNVTLHRGESTSIRSGEFHTVYTVSMEPSCYMYAFVNETLKNLTDDTQSTLREYDSVLGSLKFRFENLKDALLILRSCFNKFFYNIPIPVRMN